MSCRVFNFLAAFAAISCLIVAEASATVLYSDTFSRVTGSGDGNGDPNGAADNFSDWGTNDNGLGGTNAQAWVSGPSRAGGGRNAVTDGSLGISHGTGSLYEFDAAAAAPNGFTVALEFSRFVVTPDPGPGAGGFISVGLGVDAGTAINEFTPTNVGDFAVLFQQAAQGNAANAEVFADGASLGTFDYLSPDTAHTLLLTVTPQTAGAYGSGDTVDINVLVDGTISQDYSVAGGIDFGTFSVGANNFDTRFIDNLVVTAIPEPTSIVLFGLGCVAIFSSRKR
ncbi:MAG: PEP-CTERM sorting domain-containing protein [Lacipirellulaceae bacterium]